VRASQQHAHADDLFAGFIGSTNANRALRVRRSNGGLFGALPTGNTEPADAGDHGRRRKLR